MEREKLRGLKQKGGQSYQIGGGSAKGRKFGDLFKHVSRGEGVPQVRILYKWTFHVAPSEPSLLFFSDREIFIYIFSPIYLKTCFKVI